MTEAKLEQKPGDFPPRITVGNGWYSRDGSNPARWTEGKTEYLSMPEHDHEMLKQRERLLTNAKADIAKARAEAFEELVETTEAQAEDPGLWFQAETAPEDYVQMHLRKLHRIIESKAIAARAESGEGEK